MVIQGFVLLEGELMGFVLDDNELQQMMPEERERGDSQEVLMGTLS
jgi:hypothetical protein